jgi:hypothetical protein
MRTNKPFGMIFSVHGHARESNIWHDSFSTRHSPNQCRFVCFETFPPIPSVRLAHSTNRVDGRPGHGRPRRPVARRAAPWRTRQPPRNLTGTSARSQNWPRSTDALRAGQRTTLRTPTTTTAAVSVVVERARRIPACPVCFRGLTAPGTTATKENQGLRPIEIHNDEKPPTPTQLRRPPTPPSSPLSATCETPLRPPLRLHLRSTFSYAHPYHLQQAKLRVGK